MPQNHHSELVAKKEMPLNEKVSFLITPAVYPGNAKKVEAKETHLSWVFLVDGFVYKLKKPVSNSFFDFRTLEARLQNSIEEVRVNQRLAKEIYLGIVPLVINEGGHLQVDGKGKVVDWMVKMKRIPEEDFLDYAILYQNTRKELISISARVLTEFYMKAIPIPIDALSYRKKLKEEIVASHLGLVDPVYHFSPSVIKEITNKLLKFLDSQYLLFDNRIANGKVIEAHGDLKPEHICLKPQCAFIDALEFSKELRTMDIAEELSFLDMECEMKGDPVTGKVFLDYYQKLSADKIAEALIFFYKSKKALLRAYLVARHITERGYKDDPKWLLRGNAYLQLAYNYAAKLIP